MLGYGHEERAVTFRPQFDLQRLLGNILGGWLAAGLVIAIPSGVGLAFVTFVVVFLTSFTKVRLRTTGGCLEPDTAFGAYVADSPLPQVNDLTRFGGFFCVTFVIVAYQGFYMSSHNVVILAGSRVAAICIGVVMALMLSCTIFPLSASGKVGWNSDCSIIPGEGPICMSAVKAQVR